MNFVEMILAFIILCGVALFFCSTLRMNMGEGMLLSASTVVLFFYLSSLAGTFTYGLYAIFAVSAAGGILLCVKLIRTRGQALKISPAFIMLALIFVGSWIVLYNDFIQHIDEFHQWAAAVKYMLERDILPTGADFVGGGGQYGFATSLFHLFFQKIAGYSEQNMYVSAALLTWIGFLLPFYNHSKKNWKKVALYSVIMYIALYSLYMYGTKSLYVDVPVAAWAGGLAAWWIYREKKRSNFLVAAAGCIMLHFSKQSAGLLMAVFVLLFMLTHTFVIEKGLIHKEKVMRKLPLATGVLCGLVLLGSVGLYTIACNVGPGEKNTEFSVEQVAEQQIIEDEPWTLAGIKLPAGLANLFEFAQVSQEKAQKTLGTFVKDVFGAPMSARSNLKLAYVPFMLVILLLFKISGDLYGKKKENQVYIYYSIFTALSYALAVYFAYVFMFAYELSVDMRSGIRYFAGGAIYLFVIVMAVLFQDEQVRKESVYQYVSLGVFIVFAYGINKSYIPNATALDKDSISGYEKIGNTMHQTAQLEALMDETDRVYFISQYAEDNLSGVELVSASAYYYLEEQISNYLREPWRFSESGCSMRLENFDYLTINNLPDLLTQGGYTYLWVNRSDKYLRKHLPEVLKCEEVGNNYLYKIIYENGMAAGLEFVQVLEELPEE